MILGQVHVVPVTTVLESGSLLKMQLMMTFLTEGRLLDSNLKEPEQSSGL